MADVHTCEECGKRLATMGGLEIHMAMAHGADAPEPAELEAMDPQPAMGMSPPPMPTASPSMGLPRAPKPVRPPRPPLFGGIDPAEPLAWILTVLLFLGGVVAVTHHPHPPSDIANASAVVPIPETTTTTADPVAEGAAVNGALLGSSDLAGWSVVSTRTIPADELATPDACLADPALNNGTAGAEQQLQFGPGRATPARLVITVVRVPSSSSAAAQLAATKTPAYVPCIVKVFEAGLREGGGGAVHVRSTEETAPPAVAVTVPASVHRLVTHAYGDTGATVDVTTDDYVFATGRMIAHVFFAAVGPSLAPAIEAHVVQALVQHMTQAPA